MIPFGAITDWGTRRPWPTRGQVEQDLLLSRCICEIANHPVLSDELVFRGGTALHKLHLAEPLRYSEDLDYVRTTAGGIKPIMRALTDLGEQLGFDVTTKISDQPKVLWRTTSQSGSTLRIKVEINTHERAPALRHHRLTHIVSSPWWSGTAEVLTFQVEELVATKIRALFQRRKGRDLFDLWIALDRQKLAPERIISAFEPYRPETYTSKAAIANLQHKVRDERFRQDLIPLVRELPPDYDVDDACGIVIDRLLAKIDG